VNRPVNRLGLLALQILVGLNEGQHRLLQGDPEMAPDLRVRHLHPGPLQDLDRGTNPEIWGHLWITLQETVLAFVFGAAGGIAFGFLFARNGTR
jgi:NitT/TauT family transport system permease protein